MTKKTRIGTILVTMGAAVLLFAFGSNNDKNYSANDPVYKDLDTTAKPGDDFFQYANGGWIKKNPIPAAYASWGIGNIVIEDVRDRLKKINEDALKANAPQGSNT